MIFFQRRRLIFWLLKAYLKQLRRMLVTFFLLGVSSFFVIYILLNFIKPQPLTNSKSIGIVGSYTPDNLPQTVLSKISYGLTEVSQAGDIKPKAASSWSIKDNGKTYVFSLRNDQYFSDNTPFVSEDLNYNFSDVEVSYPSKNTVVFKLKNNYSPFLLTVSKPIFKVRGAKKLIGLGEYGLRKINLNGDFVESLIISSRKDKSALTYKFYPTEDSLKVGLMLGEIDETADISNLSTFEENLSKFKNLNIRRYVNYNKLATVFYNTQNKDLSDKRLREALSYALPDKFNEGERVHTPYPPQHWVSQEETLYYSQDIEHAKTLLKDSSASLSANLLFILKTLPKYEKTALNLQKAWENIGIKIKIEKVTSLPSNFDIFLGEFIVSKDPDQYVLWHSNSSNNITGYKNLRIDKLLEDGRQVADKSTRGKIYADFQKYLLDDPPSSFLFFPYNYFVSK